MLRRYVSGYTLLGDYLARESEVGRLAIPPAQLLKGRAAVLDRLIAAVSAEYEREQESRLRSSAERQAELVRRLLAGEPIDTTPFSYEFDQHHLGLVASGAGGEEALRELARELDCHTLSVAPEGEVAWAWIGTRSRLDLDDLVARPRSLSSKAVIAAGEPGEGLSGWRVTHRQALAALSVAEGVSQSVVRYRDVALLASVLKDDLLVTSLRQLYLAPLGEQRDGGKVAIETLRAYFAADRNASSAAAALGVNRNTIGERLRGIEAAIGRPLAACAPELEAALHLARSRATDSN